MRIPARHVKNYGSKELMQADIVLLLFGNSLLVVLVNLCIAESYYNRSEGCSNLCYCIRIHCFIIIFSHCPHHLRIHYIQLTCHVFKCVILSELQSSFGEVQGPVCNC